MAFVTQRPEDGNSCGAFCLAYYQWLREGRNPEQTRTDEQKKKIKN